MKKLMIALVVTALTVTAHAMSKNTNTCCKAKQACCVKQACPNCTAAGGCCADCKAKKEACSAEKAAKEASCAGSTCPLKK